VAQSGSAEFYRSKATVCVDLAARTADSEARLWLLHMAHAWRALAEQADKNDKIDLVYETQEPQRHVVQQQQQPQPDETAAGRKTH
jgi:hypothetical protein